jgi:hypothetical protein
MSTKNSHSKYSNYYINKCKQSGEKANNKFIAWINEVESQVVDLLHCLLLDLPDEAYMINFEDKMTPKDMADIVISSNMIFVMNNVVLQSNMK